VCTLDRGEGVAVIEDKGLGRSCGDADLGARAPGDGFVEPDLLEKGRVRDPNEQCGSGSNQRPSRLFFGQSVEAAVERRPVLVEKHLELGPCGLIDDTLGDRGGPG